MERRVSSPPAARLRDFALVALGSATLTVFLVLVVARIFSGAVIEALLQGRTMTVAGAALAVTVLCAVLHARAGR